jgi:pilus assembly protein CpaC
MLLKPAPRFAVGALLAAAGIGTPALAAPAKVPAVTGGPATVCETVSLAPVVNLPLGKSTLVRPPTPVARVVMGQASAAAVGPEPGAARTGVADIDLVLLSPSELYLMGKSLGTTNVVLAGRDGRCTAFDVIVTMDTSSLQATLQQLVPDEKDVKVTSAFDSIVLSGTVSDTEALARITELAGAYVRNTTRSAAPGQVTSVSNPRVVNMLSVAAPQQVMLEVKVAEISKSLLDQFGIDFARAFVSGNGSAINFLSGILGGGAAAFSRVAGAGPNGSPLSSVGVVVGSSAPAGAAASMGNVTVTYDTAGRPVYTTSYGTVPGQRATAVNANMQKTDGLVKVLAEPSVMAVSGQTGSFLAGGKIFIPMSQTNVNGTRDLVLEEREFGVALSFTPTVLGGGRINLKVRPEVSELNATGIQVTTGAVNTVLPSFSSRRAETTVQLMDGQSFAIGGLIKNNSTTNIKAFPFLGELPVVGALFRSTEFQTDRTELVFVITPRLVKPLPADYKLPTDRYVPPTRSELIWGGKTEGTPPEREPAAGTAPAGGGFELPGKTEK